jgi:FKBP-type peptidyl-prolyl cis-trans isomerase
MNPFNKYQAIGIFLSIGAMAVALSVVRFRTDILSMNAIDLNSQRAVVAVSQDNEGVDANIRETLTDSFSADQRLVRMVVDDIRIGTGKEVAEGDTVVVQYVGRTQNGIEFANSYKKGEPYAFKIGDGKVIEGLEKGVVGMRTGGTRILVIPSDLAYGNRQVGVIEPNSPLVFSIELQAVK